MSRRGSHLSEGGLLEHVLAGTLPPGARAHLPGCASCRSLLAETEQLVRDVRADRTPRPSAALVRRVEDLIHQPIADPLPRPAAAIPEVTARRRRPAAALLPVGVRSDAATAARLRFIGEKLDVDLEITRSRGNLRVLGQILGRQGALLPTTARLECEGAAALESPIGEHGVFAFAKVAAEPFDIVLDLGERRLRLRGIRSAAP